MARLDEKQAKHRRGADPAEEEYLARVGERLRNNRARQGMSRKVLSLASGVSERYLAEMERGAGNASLLVMRRLAAALGIRVSELTAEAPGRRVRRSREAWGAWIHRRDAEGAEKGKVKT